MTTQPTWDRVDNYTADLLSLVRDEGHPSADIEWDEFLRAVQYASQLDAGPIYPNRLRPMLRGIVAPRRIGAFTNRALKLGLVEYTGDWQISDDRCGKNAGKPARVMRWVGESQ